MSVFGSLDRRAEILLVEDNPLDVRLTQIAFRKIEIEHNFHVVVDGHDAVAFLQRKGRHADAPRPDLVLLDLNMPGKDGRVFLKEVKEDKDLRRIPIIILTTSAADKDLFNAYNFHANAYLTKPLDLHDWDDLVQGLTHFWLKLVKYPP